MKKRGLMGLLAVGLLVGLLLPASMPVLAGPGAHQIEMVSEALATPGEGTQTAGWVDESPYTGAPPSFDPLDETAYSGGAWSNAVDIAPHTAWATENSAPVSGAYWVSTDAANGSTCEGDGTIDQWRLFKHDYAIPAHAVNIQGQLWMTTDNAVAAYTNGSLIKDLGGAYVAAASVTPGIFASVDGPTAFSAQTGANVLQFVVRNRAGNQDNPTGLLYRSVVEYDIASLDIVKSADVGMVHEGDTITYTYLLTNDGDVPLTGVSVTDSMGLTLTLVDNGNGDAVLDPGEQWEYEAKFVADDQYDPVINTATATASYGEVDVEAESNEVVVDVLHPAISLVKEGPPWRGYFESVEAEYRYFVTNDGDCTLYDVALEDYPLGTLTSPSGDNGNGFLEEDETWEYVIEEELICEGDDMTEFPNFAVVTAEDELGMEVMDCDCWNVLVFQWQPRTIGYWGNWDNHMDPGDIGNLVRWVNAQSDYFGDECGGWLTVEGVESILGEPVEKGKMDEGKALLLLKKQLIATWLNVKSFEGLHDDNALTWGAADAAINPGATVYVDGEADGTVRELLARIEYGLCRGNLDVRGMLTAKDLLDEMNNAENNGYSAFMESELDKSECRPCLVGEWEMDLYMGGVLYDRFVVIASQSDGEITGVMGIPGQGPTGNVSGDVDCLNIYMLYDREGYATTGYTAEFWGTLAMDGNSASGTWADYHTGDPAYAPQTWYMTKT